MRILTLLACCCLSAGAADYGALEPEMIVEGLKFTEGPAWHPDGYLLFSDIPASRIYRWQDGKLTVFREPSEQSNGLAFDARGRLLACEHKTRRVTRTRQDGSIEVLADRFEGKRLNSPNDLALHADGAIYFTDPPYGLGRQKGELGFCGVYRIAPDGALTLLRKDLDRPNGIGLSPDGKTLYVDDSHRRHVYAHPVQADGSLGEGRLLIDLAPQGTRVLDGMTVDGAGRLYVTGTKGVFVVSPEGKLLGKIPVPADCANCTLAGPDRRTLYITARGYVYRVRLPE